MTHTRAVDRPVDRRVIGGQPAEPSTLSISQDKDTAIPVVVLAWNMLRSHSWRRGYDVKGLLLSGLLCQILPESHASRGMGKPQRIEREYFWLLWIQFLTLSQRA